MEELIRKLNDRMFLKEGSLNEILIKTIKQGLVVPYSDTLYDDLDKNLSPLCRSLRVISEFTDQQKEKIMKHLMDLSVSKRITCKNEDIEEFLDQVGFWEELECDESCWKNMKFDTKYRLFYEYIRNKCDMISIPENVFSLRLILFLSILLLFVYENK